jgi:6-phosphogluconolactonase
MKNPLPKKQDAPQEIRWHIGENAVAVAAEACRRILLVAEEAIAARGRFRLVLAGGNTPQSTYELLTGAAADWSRWEIYFSDERCLPRDDPRRNSVMARRAWLDRASFPPENIHPIPGELGAMEAARRYGTQVEPALPFDLVLLGLGEDGHTASLFPGHTHPEGDLVHPVFDAPKPPSERVTLSAAALSRTRHLLVLLCGETKRQAVTAWCRGADLPIRRIRPSCPLDVLADRPAAGNR